jgi:ABC-type multidrug transport system ATPase subunit
VTTGSTLQARALSQRFGETVALDDFSLGLSPGEIHGLLGPNGAGKTTLLRIVAGLLRPTEGEVFIDGANAAERSRVARSALGFVPSGDRTFYLRLSGLENLAFIGALYGYTRREALGRARDVLGRVQLAEVASLKVGAYSHGMQKRLSFARALLTDPRLLLVDEATHDLDPRAARRIRTLTTEVAASGTAVIWATQRLDEIRGFVDGVTILAAGATRFQGSVAELLSRVPPRRYLLRVQNGGCPAAEIVAAAGEVLGDIGTLSGVGDPEGEHFTLSLQRDGLIGAAIIALEKADLAVVACREERSQIEDAFLGLTKVAP